MITEKNKSIRERLAHFYKSHTIAISIVAFILGFLVDVLTLSEIDNSLSILQQFVYLTLVGGLLYFEIKNLRSPLEPPKGLRLIWSYRSLISHFLLGSLLSIYSIFYFKSSSLMNSFLFMILIFALMIANEFQRVQSSGVWVKLVLWTLSLVSFLSIFTSVFLGSIGGLIFTITLILTLLILIAIFLKIKPLNLPKEFIRKQILLPTSLTLIFFVLFYMLGLIPPIPLSAKYMGIYHNIEKYQDQYHLYHSNPFWKFWNHGDQNFYARPDDKVFFFFKLYSPAGFSDKIIIHWLYKDPQKGWETRDRISMDILGGRKEGFRGYTFKSRYNPGDWKIQIETLDRREIGRLFLSIYEDSSASERIFEKDIH